MLCNANPRRIPMSLAAASTMLVAFLTGCVDTRLNIEQSGKSGVYYFQLTAKECTWANTSDGKSILALTYQWDTHAGNFILEGVRSRYLRLVINLPEVISTGGATREHTLEQGMVQAYDDYTDRGMCFTGGPGRVIVLGDKENNVTGSFLVTCRGFLPGRGEKSLFSDDYILSARFEARPNAAATLKMADDVGLFFATPQRTFPPLRTRRKPAEPPIATPKPAPQALPKTEQPPPAAAPTIPAEPAQPEASPPPAQPTPPAESTPPAEDAPEGGDEK